MLIKWRFSAQFEIDWKHSVTAALFISLALAQTVVLSRPAIARRSSVGVRVCGIWLLFLSGQIRLWCSFLAVVVKQCQLWASREFLKANASWLRFGTIIGYAEREFGQHEFRDEFQNEWCLKFSFRDIYGFNSVLAQYSAIARAKSRLKKQTKTLLYDLILRGSSLLLRDLHSGSALVTMSIPWPWPYTYVLTCRLHLRNCFKLKWHYTIFVC